MRERDRLEQEFFAEADEILERADLQVRALEEAAAAGRPLPPLVHLLFRDIHALKAIAGSLGFQEVFSLAHDFEDLLDRLRTGRSAWDGSTRALLQDAVEALIGLVGERRRSGAAGEDRADLRRRLSGTDPSDGESVDDRPDPPPDLPIDAALLASLSRYEEDRLRARLGAGDTLSLVRVGLDPASFDAQARSVAAALAERGEVLSMLPEPRIHESAAAGSAVPEDPGLLPFLFLVASHGDLEAPAPIAGLSLQIKRVAPPAAAGASGDRAPASGGVPDAGTTDLPLLPESVRVPVGRLNDLLVQVSDLSVAAASLLEAARRSLEARPLDREARDLDLRARALLPRLRALQRGTVQVRLVPLGEVLGRLARLVTRAARSTRKEVDLQTLGAETEIDRTVMDELAAPLRHLLLNALDHGIEPAGERESAGKPRRGRIVVSAFQKAGRVTLDIIDDGRGLDLARVRAAAEASGSIPPGAVLSEEQLSGLIFQPGVSTAPRVGPLSGRGVGLDAVRGAIRRLKGSVAVRTTPGQGTTFTLTVPISLALVQALIVRAGLQRYAIPVGAIQEHLKLDGGRLRTVDGREVYDQPRGPLPLRRVEDLVPGCGARVSGGQRYAVVSGTGKRRIGLVVDELVGRREIVIKPLGGRLREMPGIAGAAELGDATAVLVLDPEGLLGEEIDGGLAA